MTYGVPIHILQFLIKEFEDRFGYNLQEDNPYDLLSHIKSKILVVHDQNDKTIPHVDSLEASRKFHNVSLQITHGLGHKRILFDRSTVDFIVGHISSKICSRASINHPSAQEQKMRQSSFKIKEKYILADFENRLHLYLECPDLRKDFIDIEQRFGTFHQ